MIVILVLFTGLSVCFFALNSEALFVSSPSSEVTTNEMQELASSSSVGDYNEAIAVMLFYQIGELFQSYAVGKSRKNLFIIFFGMNSYNQILTGIYSERLF